MASKSEHEPKTVKPSPLLQENVTDTRGPELLIKLSYPEEVGPIGEDNLTEFLLAAQQIHSLWNVKCTVASRVSDPVQSVITKALNEPDSASTVQSPCSSSIAANNNLEVTRYFCKSAISNQELHTKGSVNTLTPTLLIELFFTYDPEDQRDIIAQDLKSKLVTKVLKDVVGGPTAVSVKIISFLLAKD